MRPQNIQDQIRASTEAEGEGRGHSTRERLGDGKVGEQDTYILLNLDKVPIL